MSRNSQSYKQFNVNSKLIVLPGGRTDRAYSLGDAFDKTCKALASARKS